MSLSTTFFLPSPEVTCYTVNGPRDSTRPSSLDIHIEKFLEDFDHVLWLAGDIFLKSGPHLLVKALSKFRDHSSYISTLSRQHPIANHVVQEITQNRKDVPLHRLGLSWISQRHKHCNAEERERERFYEF